LTFRQPDGAKIARPVYSLIQKELLMKMTLAALVLIGVAGLLLAQERFDYRVRDYFFAGFAGDAASLEKGMKICEDSLAADPKNAEALVWHGSGLFYASGQASQKGDLEKGGDLWKRGLKEMDQAVELAPDQLGVIIPRGAVLLTGSRYVGSPEMARPLIEKAVSDFEKAYRLQAPDFDTLGTHPRGELMIGLADGYNRLGNQEKAREWFERIQKSMPGTAYEKSATTWLETKSLAPAQSGCLGCHTGK
jgi:tetratricopeptide (TPR) repeat protein